MRESFLYFCPNSYISLSMPCHPYPPRTYDSCFSSAKTGQDGLDLSISEIWYYNVSQIGLDLPTTPPCPSPEFSLALSLSNVWEAMSTEAVKPGQATAQAGPVRPKPQF